MKLSLVFPVYNEEASIAHVIERFVAYCRERQIDCEFIIVNDGSTDASAEKIRTLAASNPQIRLIEHSINQGYGAALRSGFAAACGDYIFFTDSDGQFEPDDLASTLPRLHPSRIVAGYRNNRADSLLRRLNAWAWGRCIAVLLGVRVRDLNCAWKVFPRSLVSDVPLVSQGAFINAELLYYATKKQFVFDEIPVHHFSRESGVSSGAHPGVITRALGELLHFFIHHKRA